MYPVGPPVPPIPAFSASALNVPVYVPEPELSAAAPVELTVVLTKPVVAPVPPVFDK